MPRDTVFKVALGATLLGLLGWVGLTRYSQPRAISQRAEPLRHFLTTALAGDSAALETLAGDPQPVGWALAAVRQDSAIVREWARNRGRVKLSQRGDTLWVVLSRNRSTPNCSYFGSLTGALVGMPDRARLVRLSASCPQVPTASDS